MTQFLPPNLLALFAPRDPLIYLPPVVQLPHEKRTGGYDGVGQFLNCFEDPKDTPPPTKIETREERLERKHREKEEQAAYKLEQNIALWEPSNPVNGGTTDPFKSLFVGRVNYDTTESKLRREFEAFGLIGKIVVVHDRKNGKPRGYAFIEYEHERDMHSAYKHADGKKIDGRRVLVDVERSRTVTGWLPRRLGGGLGGTRRGGPDVNDKHSGRADNRTGGEDRDRSPVPRERERRRRDTRSRSRDREQPRERRRERKRRSRDRSRDRDREAVAEDRVVGDGTEVEEAPPRKERERRRSRSRERERKRSRRSRSRERGDRKRRDRRDRDYQQLDKRVVVKQENDDDGYDNNGAIHDYPDDSGGGGTNNSGTSVVPKYEDYNSNNSRRDDTNSNSNQFNSNYYNGGDGGGGVTAIKVEPQDVDEDDD